jgi:hypothetical protein
MYDYNFGVGKDHKKNPEKFLIFIKRLLPRWANGISDSECIAIFKILKSLKQKKKKRLVLLETGCGASTLAMFLYCALYGGTMYSWDINGSKGSFLKSVISESMGKVLGVDVNNIWNFIACSSLNPNAGVAVIKELNKKADFCFFDSWHTLDHVMLELKAFEIVASSKFVVAFDDAYYTKKHTNDSYINMLRYKLNLKKIKQPKNNVCKPLSIEVENYLKAKYKKVVKINKSYKANCRRDIYFNYFNFDREFTFNIGMAKDKKTKLFAAFSVEK